jgi:hypothetical protein
VGSRNLYGKKMGKASNLISRMMTSLVVVLVHFFIVFLFPIPLLVLHVWVLFEMDALHGDIHHRYFTIMDILFPSSYDFWWDNIPYKWTMYITYGITAAFYLFGFLEMMSFYFSGALDTGRYPVRQTKCKRRLVGIFWGLLFFLIAIYSAYLGLALVWALLAAILNPSKFLPYASASATLMTFVKTKISFAIEFIKGLTNMVGETVLKTITEMTKKGMSGAGDMAKKAKALKEQAEEQA